MQDNQSKAPEWLLSIVERLVRIETLLLSHSESQEGVKRDIEKITLRIETLEKFRYMLVGAALAAGGVGGVIVEKLFALSK